jgi:hypothetical protein
MGGGGGAIGGGSRGRVWALCIKKKLCVFYNSGEEYRCWMEAEKIIRQEY